MFEQSFLLDPSAGKKTGALAASLTVQTLLVGILIALPLIYSDRLPDVRQYIPLSLPSPPPPPLPQHVQAAASSSSSRSNLTPARIYTPRRIVDLSRIPDVGVVEAPPSFGSSVDIGVPGGTGATPIMS